MKVVFASSNSGKTRELQALMEEFDITLIPQSALNVSDIPETGLTFVENAILKARHASAETNLPAIADDSGLEVAALNGAPGIYSARYAGPTASSQDNIIKLLDDLKHIPKEKHQARFYCVLVYLSHADDPTPLICQGTWNGSIITTQHGIGGFGYDPVFYVPTENKTAAELPLEIKNSMSHRAAALRKLMQELPTKL
jgi:XTP/dITP diphosphohydrolase